MDVNETIIMLLMGAVGVCVVAFVRHWHTYHTRTDRMSRSLRFHVHAELAVRMPPQGAFGQRPVG